MKSLPDTSAQTKTGQTHHLTSGGTIANTTVGHANHSYVKTLTKHSGIQIGEHLEKSLILKCAAILIRIIFFPTYHLLFIKVAIIKQFLT